MKIITIDKDRGFFDSLAKYFRGSDEIEMVDNFLNIEEAVSAFSDKSYYIDFIFLDLREQHMDLKLLENAMPISAEIIAFYNTDMEMKNYINAPNFKRVFAKNISYASLLSYLRSQKASPNMRNVKNYISKTLATLGFNLNHSGTNFLVEGTLLAITHRSYKLIEIYRGIANIYHSDEKLVSWSITNAINKALKSGDEKKLQSFFQIHDNRRITAKYIITYFSNYH